MTTSTASAHDGAALAASQPPGATETVEPAALERTRGGHLLIFPVLLNAWPALLLVSQKAFVPFGLLLAGAGTPAYRRDLGVAALMATAAAAMFAVQVPGEFAGAHLIGYLLFVFAVPLINLAVRTDSSRLLHLLALLSIVNAVLAIVVYSLAIDLSAFRGLNRIIGDDDATHRVYFESTCLIAVFSVAGLRVRWQRVVATLLVLANALFLAKSIFVVTLFALNHIFPVVLRGSPRQRLAALIVGSGLLALGLLVLAALRPDVALSIGIKAFQIEFIREYSSVTWWGAGWGHVIDEIVNSEAQPYQVEMQLPMLLGQIGIAGVAIYAAGMWLLVRSASRTATLGWLRWLAYLAIGFNNPWLFLPSWYLTASLLFKRMEPPR